MLMNVNLKLSPFNIYLRNCGNYLVIPLTQFRTFITTETELIAEKLSSWKNPS